MTNLELWKNQALKDPELKKELDKLKGDELIDAFNGDLEFGTGGIRGVMGVGSNRMNVYTLRKANYGFGKYLVSKYKDKISSGVVVSHDNRLNSREFAIESCKVLSAFGIKTYMFDSLRTTPELSFSVRYLNCIAGIMITASHNPSKYNGYKIYDETGCQYTPEYAKLVTEEIDKIDDIFNIPYLDIEKMKLMGLYKILDNKVDDAFIEAAKTVQLSKDTKKIIKLVYSPLHGTGAETAKRILSECGYDATFVKEQMVHDPLFKTVTLPNPEDPNAFKLASEYGKKINADLLIATDPDADRVGIGVKHNNEYVYLTGNQTGALLINYILNRRKELGTLPKKGKVFNTIVTSELGSEIARSFGYQTFSTLTGFKFIGEQVNLLEKTDYEYLFGFEESYGYLIKTYARDKDSIQSLLLISEMANYYLVNYNKTLVDVLDDIYKKYGYYIEETTSIMFEGVNGKAIMSNITNYFRTANITKLGGVDVLIKEDYLARKRTQVQKKSVQKLTLPVSDVVKFILDNNQWVVLRPSGTEPKLKIYFSSKGSTLDETKSLINAIKTDVLKIVEIVKETNA